VTIADKEKLEVGLSIDWASIVKKTSEDRDKKVEAALEENLFDTPEPPPDDDPAVVGSDAWKHEQIERMWAGTRLPLSRELPDDADVTKRIVLSHTCNGWVVTFDKGQDNITMKDVQHLRRRVLYAAWVVLKQLTIKIRAIKRQELKING